MLTGFAQLLAFQCAGQAIVTVYRLPISGPICGMALLLLWLHVTDHPDDRLCKAADGLLSHIALLFVPAGVGVVAFTAVLHQHGLAIAAAILISTVLALATTATLFAVLTRSRTMESSLSEFDMELDQKN